jgi:hypothetical protein
MLSDSKQMLSADLSCIYTPYQQPFSLSIRSSNIVSMWHFNLTIKNQQITFMKITLAPNTWAYLKEKYTL